MREDEIERLRTRIKLLQRRLRQEALPVTGLSLTAARVLGAVARAPEEAQPRQLAERLTMTGPNVSAALRELEAAHLISRARDPLDGRKVRIVLTSGGRETVARSRRERDSWLGQAIHALLDEDEQQQLSAAGELLERLAGYQPPAPPDTP
ncbi:MarR family winged helix-turn-helix transcriptional regulator [Actinoallomurus rhizosphaericola]|uniref:MarR family winged helix-turn-helix transcriptional regulator n=1 Tax=Actinoallomurus rhizosphaericola TaxID=2952536 RepID=UPI002093BF9E|nr:MarR family winged helix-turn-helix transcriptional regulator [Actinoallomurus rhizosphaericola]MCO5998918.1 MarR family winged helix-turn-helix transcriptional regulator [Actinoallomurus rhizosphaericola]